MTSPTPPVVDRKTWERERNALLVREKAHTKEGDAIAAARRRLPMVEVETSSVIGPNGEVPLVDVFDGRDELIVYKHMWHPGEPHENQCEGCTFSFWFAQDPSYLNARGISLAVFIEGPMEEVLPFWEFMGYDVPVYSVAGSQDPAVAGELGSYAVYLNHDGKIYQTFDTLGGRGVELAMVPLKLMDLSVYGRQEEWEDSPDGWPHDHEAGWYWRKDGRPTAQWTRPDAGEVSPSGRHHHH